MKICVAGGGIGGCVAALMLAGQGHDVHLFEAVPVLRPLGVGINLLPHAVEKLDRIGLSAHLEAMGVATRELVYYNKHGQRIWTEPRGRYAGYPVPQLSIHRGLLQSALFDEAVRRLGADRIHTGHRLINVERHGEAYHSAIATFVDTAGVNLMVEADLLIGADGIHSTLRHLCYPEEGPPIYGRRLLWRATSRARPFLTGSTMIMAGYQDRKFVAYPIDAPAADGLQTINWIAELLHPEQPKSENWSREGSKDDFAGAFADWRFDWLDIPGLIASADQVFEYPLVDRDPLDRWSFGRTTLLGDAAHPMYPIGSNGASQAILDAAALTEALARHDHPIDALAAYEADRQPATSAIILANRGNGPEQCMQIAEERAPNGFAAIEDVIPTAELEAIAAGYKNVAGFARDAVARMASRSR